MDDQRNAGVGRLRLVQPGAGDLHRAHPGDRGAQHAGEGGVATAEVDPRHAAGAVRHRAERDVHPLAAHLVASIGTVARGVHPVVTGALAVIDSNRPLRPRVEAGIGSE